MALPANPFGQTSISSINLDLGNASLPSPTTTFPKFPNLAIEIRKRILRHCCFVSRVVDVIHGTCIGSGGNKASFNPNTPGPGFYHTHTRPPAILSASSESRNEALKYYEKSFFHPGLFVNYAADYIYLETFVPYVCPVFFRLVKGRKAKLVMSSNHCQQAYQDQEEIMKGFSELVLVERSVGKGYLNGHDHCSQQGKWNLKITPFTDIVHFACSTLKIRMDATMLLADLAWFSAKDGHDDESKVEFPHVQILQLQIQDDSSS